MPAAGNGSPFEVPSDLDSSVMKAYRLYFELAPELVAVYRKHNLDIVDYNGPGHLHRLQAAHGAGGNCRGAGTVTAMNG